MTVRNNRTERLRCLCGNRRQQLSNILMTVRFVSSYTRGKKSSKNIILRCLEYICYFLLYPFQIVNIVLIFVLSLEIGPCSKASCIFYHCFFGGALLSAGQVSTLAQPAPDLRRRGKLEATKVTKVDFFALLYIVKKERIVYIEILF